jgi:hypothetical protein
MHKSFVIALIHNEASVVAIEDTIFHMIVYLIDVIPDSWMLENCSHEMEKTFFCNYDGILTYHICEKGGLATQKSGPLYTMTTKGFKTTWYNRSQWAVIEYASSR